MQTYTNTLWKDSSIKPIVSIVTPVYNRRNIVQRTIKSVLAQSFKNIEYIIVDDGSKPEEQIDDIVFDLFETVNIPMMFIKKENGGVHTARNVGFAAARGEFLFNLDSDDEMHSDAVTICLEKWESIPDKTGFREVVGRCCDENGNLIGNPFPDNINDLPLTQAFAECRKAGGEHYGMFLTSVMKENPFPEYSGVTFITERVLWDKLAYLGYKSYYVNDVIRTYHTESTDSYTFRKKKKKQNIINSYFETTYFLNNWQYYNYGVKSRLFTHFRRSIMARLKGKDFKNISLASAIDKLMSFGMYLPSIVASWIYKKKYCAF